MKAIVLAGGFATRLWPITRHRPKMFLPVGETTVIDRILDELESDTRISTVYISTNERFAEAFREYLANRPYEKAELAIEGTTRENEKPGVVGALADLVNRKSITEDTVVVAGDNLISFDIDEFIDEFRANGTPMLAAYDVGTRERATSYGVVRLNSDDEVEQFREKPDNPESTLISIACYGFPADALGLLEEYLNANNNPDEPGWFIQWLVNNESVQAFSFDGAWFDIGTAESYLDTVRWKLDGDSIVHPSATIEDASIGANVHVMAGATVENADLKETVVFPDATIRDAELSGTIVDTEAYVCGPDLSGSLIGAYTEIDSS
jgi:glucose-1-phosphate thymidylyltransferase